MDRRRARILTLAAAPVLALAACGSAPASGHPTSPPYPNRQVTQAGPLAVLQTNSARAGQPAPIAAAYRLTSGALAWRIDMPTFVPVSPVPVPAGFLVQPSDPGSACAV
jgi:hypothetical protein